MNSEVSSLLPLLLAGRAPDLRGVQMGGRGLERSEGGLAGLYREGRELMAGEKHQIHKEARKGRGRKAWTENSGKSLGPSRGKLGEQQTWVREDGRQVFAVTYECTSLAFSRKVSGKI